MLRVTQVGYHFVNLNGLDIQRPEGEDQYLLLFFRTDTEVRMDGVYRPVPRFSFFLYPKGAPQFYRKTDGDFLNDWMYFDLLQDPEYFQKLNIPLCTPIHLRNPAPLNTLMMEMFNDWFYDSASPDGILADKANTFFHRLSGSLALEQNRAGSRNAHISELSELRNRLLNFSLLPSNSASIARSLHMSVSNLEHLYKELFHSTIAQDMIQGRIQHACVLLRSTDTPVTNVAYICGYESPEHFSRQFKKNMGCSPQQYRDREQG